MPDDYELEDLIRDLRLTTNADLDERILGDAVKIGEQTPSKTYQAELLMNASHNRRSASLLRRVIPTLSALIVLLCLVIWGSSHPSPSWAQVVETVQEQPWIHLHGTDSAGNKVESWLSISQKISAHKSPQFSSYANFQTNLLESYNPQIGQIMLINTDKESGDRQGFDVFSSIFQSIFRGEEQLDLSNSFEQLPNLVSVKQSRKTVREEGKKWFEYEVAIVLNDEQTSSIKIRVSAETKLPQSMIIRNDGESVEMRIDYPASGPKDIYDLGVARSTKIADTRPQAATGDAKQIVETIERVAKEFDDYFAIQVLAQPDAPWHVGTPMKIWRKAGKARNEMGFIDPDKLLSDTKPEATANRNAWWNDRCEKLWWMTASLFDGKLLYHNQLQPTEEAESFDFSKHPYQLKESHKSRVNWREFPSASKWPARTLPILWVYPQNLKELLTRNMYEAKIGPDPDDPHLFRVDIQYDSGPVMQANAGPDGKKPVMQNRIMYLLNPQRDYAVQKSLTSTFYEQENKRVILSEVVSTFSEFKQSPKGYWYPTQSRDDTTFTLDDKVTKNSVISRYYVDFAAEMDEGLFQAPVK